MDLVKAIQSLDTLKRGLKYEDFLSVKKVIEEYERSLTKLKEVHDQIGCVNNHMNNLINESHNIIEEIYNSFDE